MASFGSSRIGYLEHEINEWIRSRVRADTGERVAPPLPPPSADEAVRLISMAEVEKRIGFSRVHIWRLEKAGRFPKRIRLSAIAPEPAEAAA